jgi:hypothetical protein
MRKTLSAVAVAMIVAISFAATARVAEAAKEPSAQCYGEIIAGIASIWPWAHNDKVDFAPSPGGIALWIKEFGSIYKISSVRDLQVLFCGEGP